MRIFLSYASQYQRDIEPIAIALRNLRHLVFLDKDDLPPGTDFNEQIRAAIEQSDLLIFFITPESVAEGRFTRSELALAQKKWPGPAGHILPVMLRPTPMDDIPPYLRGVHILKSAGNLIADVQAEVANIGGARNRTSGWGTGSGLKTAAAVACVAGIGAFALLPRSGMETSLACGYRDGPKAGMVEVATWGQPMPVGSGCIDYLGSTGTLVSAQQRATLPGIDRQRFTKFCRFQSGPRAGQTGNLSMALYFPIGAPCHDGAGSIGTGTPE